MRPGALYMLVLTAFFSLGAVAAGTAAPEGAAQASAGADRDTAAGSSGPGDTASETVIVIVKDYKFIPEEITVPVGTTVRWENHERRQYHNVYFQEPGEDAADYFFPEEYRERTFDKPGTYPYICEPHLDDHDMKGVVHVVE